MSWIASGSWPTLVTWPALGTKVSQVRQEYVPQARQVTKVGQDTQVKQVPRYTIRRSTL